MTQWNKEQYEELSRKVALKFEIEDYIFESNEGDYLVGSNNYKDVWLHDDWDVIMELSIKYGIEISHLKHHGFCVQVKDARTDIEKYEYHNNDAFLADRICRLRALMMVDL